MREAQSTQANHIEKLTSSIDLMKVDLQNQLQANMKFTYENMILKSQERKYMELINEAKQNHQSFLDRFKGAQDFLESEPLIQMFINRDQK